MIDVRRLLARMYAKSPDMLLKMDRGGFIMEFRLPRSDYGNSLDPYVIESVGYSDGELRMTVHSGGYFRIHDGVDYRYPELHLIDIGIISLGNALRRYAGNSAVCKTLSELKPRRILVISYE